MASRADYVCVNGFRHVVPYVHTWRTVAKGRWIGQEVLDLLSGEFARYPRAYFSAALSAGTVLLDGKRALPHDLLRNKSVLEHTAHRHEPPIVHSSSLSPKRYSFPLDAGSSSKENEEDYLIAINKPASWPVHPTGGYRKNSLVHIMENEHGYSFGSGAGASKDSLSQGGGGEGGGGLRMLYRLDRLTSGLILFASTHKSCAAFLKRLQTTNDGVVVGEKEGKGLDGRGTESNNLADDARNSSSPFLDGVKKMYLVKALGRFTADEISKRFIDDKDVSIYGTFTSWSLFRSNYLGMNKVEKMEGKSTDTIPHDSCSGLEIFTPTVLRVRHPVCPVPGKRGRFYSGPSARIALQEDSSSLSPSSLPKGVLRKAVGKESVTDFVPVAYDAATDTTLAVAIPLTGRTHQIRVHLQGLGHSIVDDPVYGGRDSVIRSLQDTIPRTSAPEALADLQCAEQALRKELERQVEMSSSSSSSSSTTTTSITNATLSPQIHLWAMDHCPVCSISKATSSDSIESTKEEIIYNNIDDDTDDLDSDVSSESLPFRKFISLHALSYLLPANREDEHEHLFRVELPEWWANDALDPLKMK